MSRHAERLTLRLVFGLFAAAVYTFVPSAQTTESIDGLWRYQAIASRGGHEVAIDGLFLFRDGRFVQQSLNAGEPFDKQVGQAHEGTYEVRGNALKMIAEVGLVVN